MLRVLYVSGTFGGHDRRFLDYLDRAPDTRHAFAYVGKRETHDQARQAVHSSTNDIWTVDQARDPHVVADGLAQVIASYRPHIVHAGPIPTITHACAIAQAPGLTGMSWGYDLLHDAAHDTRARASARFALSNCRALLVDCVTVERAAIVLGMNRTHIVVLPWGIDIPTHDPRQHRRSTRRRLGLPERANVFFSNRAWEPIYRVQNVIEAFGMHALAHPDSWLVLAGKGSLERQVREAADHCPARDRIVLTGFLDAASLSATYAASDVYVSAAIVDGSSVSLLEAMVHELPSIVTDHPANLEWIDHDTGWTSPPDDISSLAANLDRAVSQRATWGTMGAKARSLVTTKADWARNSPRVHNAYRIALS